MKRIIDGVTYNTDTSTLIARYQEAADNYNPTDKTIDLYKTRGGAFFLHVHEEWHVKDEDSGEWQKKLKDQFEPLTREAAQKWVMDGDVEVFSEEFGLPPEAADEETPSATIYARVPQSLKARVDAAAEEAKLSTNAWALRCMENCLDTRAADSLAMLHSIASSIHAVPDGYSSEQLHEAIDDIRSLVAITWKVLKLPREKGQDIHEDIILRGAGRFGSEFESKWQPYQQEEPTKPKQRKK